MSDINYGLLMRYTTTLINAVREEFGKEDDMLTTNDYTRLTWASRGVALDLRVTKNGDVMTMIAMFKSIKNYEDNVKLLRLIIEEVGKKLNIKMKE